MPKESFTVSHLINEQQQKHVFTEAVIEDYRSAFGTSNCTNSVVSIGPTYYESEISCIAFIMVH